MTIYEALRRKLGREPTHAEIKSDVKRILADGLREMGRAKVTQGGVCYCGEYGGGAHTRSARC